MAARGLRNNNPGNIRLGSTRFQGEIKGTDKSFRTFSSAGYGYRALIKTLQTYQDKYHLMTIRGMIGRWAPGNENNTAAYVATVSKKSGYGRDQSVSMHDRVVALRIAEAISEVENGKAANSGDLMNGWELLQ